MRAFLVVDGAGFVVSVLQLADGEAPVGLPAGCTAVVAPADVRTDLCMWWDGVRVHYLPPQPPGTQFCPSSKTWVSTESEADAWVTVRMQRDALLQATEWRRWRALDQGVPVDPAWLDYWQALRDITQQPDPHNIIWPQTPAAEGSE